jgi:hypothetical protein
MEVAVFAVLHFKCGMKTVFHLFLGQAGELEPHPPRPGCVPLDPPPLPPKSPPLYV